MIPSLTFCERILEPEFTVFQQNRPIADRLLSAVRARKRTFTCDPPCDIVALNLLTRVSPIGRKATVWSCGGAICGDELKAKVATLSSRGHFGGVMSAYGHWQMDASAPELYERYLVPAITSVWANDLLDRVALRRGESLLDIACGTGVVARLAAQRGHAGRLVGVDINTAMLAVARAKSPAVEWVKGSALDLPFEADSFDVVLCQLGLQFFPDKSLALREMVRVLKPGGRTGLSVYSAIEQTPAAHAFVQSLDKYLGSASSRTKRSEHLSCNAQEVGTWANQAGFDAVDVVTVTKQITFPSMLDYVRFQLTATPMAALLKEKDAAEGERLIMSISADAASRIDPSMLTGSRLTFPQESFVVTASKRKRPLG